jgi:hypothetical protein
MTNSNWNGKVWKIEGLYQHVSTTAGTQGSFLSCLVNTTSTSNLMKRNDDQNILWLPEGTYAVRFFFTCGSSFCTGTVYNTINAIEFNIVQ